MSDLLFAHRGPVRSVIRSAPQPGGEMPRVLGTPRATMPRQAGHKPRRRALVTLAPLPAEKHFRERRVRVASKCADCSTALESRAVRCDPCRAAWKATRAAERGRPHDREANQLKKCSRCPSMRAPYGSYCRPCKATYMKQMRGGR